MKQLTLNFQNDLEPTGEMTKLSLPVGSRNHANHTQSPAVDLEKKMTATSGRKCLEQFGKFSQNGLWAKMFSELLIGTGDWYSTRCRLTWKLKGTKYKRMYFQLFPSILPTEGIGFGLLLKTPSAMDAYAENLSKKEQKMGNSGTLAQEIATGFANKRMPGLLPTPTALEYKDSVLTTEQAIKLDKGGRVLRRLGTLGILKTGQTSQLNPLFVAEMMGFPTNWTLLPFLDGEKSR